MTIYAMIFNNYVGHLIESFMIETIFFIISGLFFTFL